MTADLFGGIPSDDGHSASGPAPGCPGISPTWSSSAKDAVGTSHYASRVWFTIGHGILNEVYWPRVDRPQIRDLGFVVADGAGFWSEVKRDAESQVDLLEPGVPAVIAVHRHPRYVLTLRICADDHADVIRIEARLEDLRQADDGARASHPLRLYPLLAPHLGFSGTRNRAWTGSYKGRRCSSQRTSPTRLRWRRSRPPAVSRSGTSDGRTAGRISRRMGA